MVKQSCKSKAKNFCFACAKYVKTKSRRQFNAAAQERYKKAFGLKHIKNLNNDYTPTILCATCTSRISGAVNKEKLMNLRPAKWHQPAADHSNCYLCKTVLNSFQKRAAWKHVYDATLSCTLPTKIDGKLTNGNADSDEQDSE